MDKKRFFKSVPLLVVGLSISLSGFLFGNKTFSKASAASPARYLHVDEDGVSTLEDGTFVMTHTAGSNNYYFNPTDYSSGTYYSAVMTKYTDHELIPESAIINIKRDSGVYYMWYINAQSKRAYLGFDSSGNFKVTVLETNATPTDDLCVDIRETATSKKFNVRNVTDPASYFHAYEYLSGCPFTADKDEFSTSPSEYQFSFHKAEKIQDRIYRKYVGNGTDLSNKKVVIGAKNATSGREFLYNPSEDSSTGLTSEIDRNGLFVHGNTKTVNAENILEPKDAATGQYYLKTFDGWYIALNSSGTSWEWVEKASQASYFTFTFDDNNNVTIKNTSKNRYFTGRDDGGNFSFLAYTDSERSSEGTKVCDLTIYERVEFYEEDYVSIELINLSMVCDTTGTNNNVTSTRWNEIKTIYNSLPNRCKTILKNATYTVTGSGDSTVASPTGSTLALCAEAIAKYDFIVAKYGYENFIGRDLPSPSSIRLFNEDSNASFIPVLVVGISISLFAIAFIFKKKEA